MDFGGLVAEHQAVRSTCGMFDRSAMGVLRLQGSGAKDALQGLVPSDLFRIGPGEACATVLLNAAGGIRNGLIVCDRGWQAHAQGHELLLLIDAPGTTASAAWLRSQLHPQGIQVSDAKGDGVLLALQGPGAQGQLEALSGVDLGGLPHLGHRALELPGIGTTLAARTGDTGEDGFELLLSRDAGRAVWERLLAAGVVPCGLAARDSLRLEAGRPLNGRDIDATTTPLEAGLGCLVHLEMPKPFIGRQALERQGSEGVRRQLVGLRLQGPAIPRDGDPVLNRGVTAGHDPIGAVTSGGWSPCLEAGIALAYVPAAAARVGTELAVQIRGRCEPAVVVRLPFYRP